MLVCPNTNQLIFTQRIKDNTYTREFPQFRLEVEDKGVPIRIEQLSPERIQNRLLWEVHEDRQSLKKIPLKNGDVFRFGRQIIEIQNIFRKGDQETVFSQNNFVVAAQLEAVASQRSLVSSGNEVKCRVCLEDESPARPFARNLCKCSENMSMHFDCLFRWVSKKCEKTKKAGITFFKVSDISCEICKEKYPPRVSFKGREVPLLNISPPSNQNYLIFSIYELEKDQICMLALIELKSELPEQVVNIGRNDKNEIYFKDSSISRLHATLVWQKNELYLFDNRSKFGTHKLLPRKFSLESVENKKVVIDKFLFTFNFSKRSKKTKNVARDPFSTDPRLTVDDPPPLSLPKGFDITPKKSEEGITQRSPLQVDTLQPNTNTLINRTPEVSEIHHNFNEPQQRAQRGTMNEFLEEDNGLPVGGIDFLQDDGLNGSHLFTPNRDNARPARQFQF